MVHSIELIFDADTEAVVRGIWDALRGAHIPAQAAAGRPHTTLTVARHLTSDADAALGDLLSGFPFGCRLGAVLIFGRSPGVLARSVVPTDQLLGMQADVHRRCLPFMDSAPMPHTAPGQWSPHVTLARRVDPDRLATAVRIAGQPAEIVGQAIGLRHWDGDRRTEHLLW